MKAWKKCVSVLLAVLTVLTAAVVGAVPGTLKAQAAGWNGYNYGGGTLYGYQTFLEAYGIDYNTYMKWLDDHDADSPNPDYYLGTPYVGEDHRNPHGDCQGAYGAYDVPGKEGMNCTGFVWHVLYKSAVHSGAPSYKINRLGVMSGMPSSWFNNGVYRIYFNTIEEAYNAHVLEKGDLFWIYGSSDSHNAIFYGDSPEDFIFWDSAGKRNRYDKVHSIGKCQGLWVAKVTQPNSIELQIDSPSGGGVKFGTKYCVFDSKAKAQAALNSTAGSAAWDKRAGTIVLDQYGHGCFRQQSAPSAAELWAGDMPRTDHSYFRSDARRVNPSSTYYAVQWSAADGIVKDNTVREFKDSGRRTGKGYRIFTFNAPVKTATPAISDMKDTSDGVKLSWKAVSGAERYRLYHQNSDGGWTRVGETAATSFTDTSVASGTEYTYTIRCVDGNGCFLSDYDKTGWAHTYTCLDTPIVTELTSTPEGVKVSWGAVEGAERYRVYFKNSQGGWTRLTETTDLSYTDFAVSKGAAYTYTVRCVDGAGDFTSGFNKNGWKLTYEGVSTPVIESISGEGDGIRLSWQPIEGARVRVYTQKKDGGWLRIAETDEAEYLDEDVTLDSTVTYTLRCVNSKGYFISDYDKKGKSCTFKGVATPLVGTTASEADGVRLTWEPVQGASLYRVYDKAASGGWTRIGETAEPTFLVGSLKAGSTHTFTLRCVNSKGKFTSAFDKTGVTVIYSLAATSADSMFEDAGVPVEEPSED